MRAVIVATSVVWIVLCIAKIILVLDNANILDDRDFEVFVGINLGSSSISIASLILIVSFYTDILPSMGVTTATVVSTLMSLGYFATWLCFGNNITLIAVGDADLTLTGYELSTYALLDSLLVCVQFVMITQEAYLFIQTRRAELVDMQRGHPLDTLLGSVIFFGIVTSVAQVIKILTIGTHWPLSNNATAAFGLISAMLSLCNVIAYFTYTPQLNLSDVQGTAAIVALSLANLLIWGSVGSSTLMMDLESKESYQVIFALDVTTGFVQIAGLALLQYLAHNLHAAYVVRRGIDPLWR